MLCKCYQHCITASLGLRSGFCFSRVTSCRPSRFLLRILSDVWGDGTRRQSFSNVVNCADLAVLEPEFHSDLVRLTAHAALAACQHLVNQGG